MTLEQCLKKNVALPLTPAKCSFKNKKIRSIHSIICLSRKQKRKNGVKPARRRRRPAPFGTAHFLFEQNLSGWTSIISGAGEARRGLSDSCRFLLPSRSLRTSRSIFSLSIRAWRVRATISAGRPMPSIQPSVHRRRHLGLNWAW